MVATMRRYAAQTYVSVEKSRAEIESLVMRRGARSFHSGWADGQAAVGFVLCDRILKFKLPLPSRDEKEFTHTPGRKKRRDDRSIQVAWEQACRSRWRALLLAIKAKLEAVDAGISVFDDEFLAFIVDPSTGETIGDSIKSQIELTYQALPADRKPIALLTGPTN